MKRKKQNKFDFFEELSWLKLKDGLILEEYNQQSEKVRLHYENITYDYYYKEQKYLRHKDNKWFDLTIEKFRVAICDPYKDVPF